MSALVDAVEGIIEGLAIPFGSPARRDRQGEYFTPETDLALDLIPGPRPVLVHHGLNDGGRVEVVGRVQHFVKTPAGIVVRVALDRASAMFDWLVSAAKAGMLGFSSGSVPHLVRTSSSGAITRWPWIELSLTTKPASLDAVVYSVKADQALDHLAAVGIAAPALKALLGHADPSRQERLELEVELLLTELRTAGMLDETGLPLSLERDMLLSEMRIRGVDV
jgi:hypothetical protein